MNSSQIGQMAQAPTSLTQGSNWVPIMHQTTLHNLSGPLTKIFLAGFLALIIAMLLTPVFTYFAYKFKFWKQMRHEALSGGEATVYEKLHAAKHRHHIPTMAGLIFVIAISIVTLVMNFSRSQTWLPLLALIGCSLVGLVDDIMNIRSHGRGVAGMRAPVKFVLISLIALALGWFFWARLGWTDIYIPFIGNWHLGFWIVPVFGFAVVATGNAVNISDGLDGLSGGLAAVAFASFAGIALLEGQFGVAAFCITVLGALVAYLWFNIFPARFFMGDTGSFALGCSLAVVAMMTNSLFLLPIIGIVFVVDTGSVIIQLIYKRLTHGKKIWLSTPIHHHFEAIGWPETKVTMRFWMVGAVAGVMGLVLALLGGIIR